MLKKIATLSAAALLATFAGVPVLAHAHDHSAHGQGEAHGKAEAGQCPHHQAVSSSMTQAMALLDEALATKDHAQMTAKATEARKQLAGMQEHMAKCEAMCKEMKCTMDHGAMNHGAMNQPAAQPAKDTKVTDLVCGMKIEAANAAAKSVYAGKTYYFCSQDEKVKFDKDPESFLKKG